VDKMFNFKKKDPICGMKQTNNGIEKYDKWFCSTNCLKIYEKGLRKINKKSSCCS